MKSLALGHLAVRFGPVEALRGVDLSIDAGEVVLLAGPNGAGKSTLIGILLGLVRADAGELRVDGEVLRGRRIDNAFKRCVGYLPESISFAENLSARGVLRFFAAARDVGRARVDAVLERVGLADAAKRRVGGFSRGMRQRLGLGAAILAEPDLLILDEPTGGLDREGIDVLFDVFDEWRRADRMVLIASHDLTLIERRIDRMCLLKAGAVIAVGTPAQLRDRAELRIEVRFGVRPGQAGEAFAAALAQWPQAICHRNGVCVTGAVVARDLLPLMALHGAHRDAVDSLDVTEPSFDRVYERLLELS